MFPFENICTWFKSGHLSWIMNKGEEKGIFRQCEGYQPAPMKGLTTSYWTSNHLTSTRCHTSLNYIIVMGWQCLISPSLSLPLPPLSCILQSRQTSISVAPPSIIHSHEHHLSKTQDTLIHFHPVKHFLFHPCSALLSLPLAQKMTDLFPPFLVHLAKWVTEHFLPLIWSSWSEMTDPFPLMFSSVK